MLAEAGSYSCISAIPGMELTRSRWGQTYNLGRETKHHFRAGQPGLRCTLLRSSRDGHLAGQGGEGSRDLGEGTALWPRLSFVPSLGWVHWVPGTKVRIQSGPLQPQGLRKPLFLRSHRKVGLLNAARGPYTLSFPPRKRGFWLRRSQKSILLI